MYTSTSELLAALSIEKKNIWLASHFTEKFSWPTAYRALVWLAQQQKRTVPMSMI